MVFEYDYGNERFLIELTEYDGGKDKVEVYSIKYSDNQDDSDDYEIEIFCVEGDQLTPSKSRTYLKSSRISWRTTFIVQCLRVFTPIPISTN